MRSGSFSPTGTAFPRVPLEIIPATFYSIDWCEHLFEAVSERSNKADADLTLESDVVQTEDQFGDRRVLRERVGVEDSHVNGGASLLQAPSVHPAERERLLEDGVDRASHHLRLGLLLLVRRRQQADLHVRVE